MEHNELALYTERERKKREIYEKRILHSCIEENINIFRSNNKDKGRRGGKERK